MNKLSFSAKTDGVVVWGKTFPVKDALKAAGGVWVPLARNWFFPAKGVNEVRSALGLPDIPPVVPVRPVPVAVNLERLEAAIAAGWVCCRTARIVDPGRKIVECNSHGLMVRGCCYTGD